MRDLSSLHYRIVGDGYPVLFLHGFLESSDMWNELLPKFQKYFKCILIDLPGHGKSPSMHQEHVSIPSFAQAVHDVVDELSLEFFSIVGHSLGGYVSLALIEKMDLFNGKLILLNSHPWPDTQTKKEERTRVIDVVNKNRNLFINNAITHLFRFPHDHKGVVQELIQEAKKMDASAIVNTLFAMRERIGRESVLEGIHDRSLVIQGKYDHLIPYLKMREYTVKNDIGFKLLNEAGHMSHIESQEKVQKIVLNYLT